MSSVLHSDSAGLSAAARVDLNHDDSAPRYLAVRRHGHIDLVALDDLLYAKGAGKYSELVRFDGRRDLYDHTLAGLATALPPGFVRIHKSYVVRLAMVKRLHVLRGSRYFAELKTGQRLPIGRSRYMALKARLFG